MFYVSALLMIIIKLMVIYLIFEIIKFLKRH